MRTSKLAMTLCSQKFVFDSHFQVKAVRIRPCADPRDQFQVTESKIRAYRGDWKYDISQHLTQDEATDRCRCLVVIRQLNPIVKCTFALITKSNCYGGMQMDWQSHGGVAIHEGASLLRGNIEMERVLLFCVVGNLDSLTHFSTIQEQFPAQEMDRDFYLIKAHQVRCFQCGSITKCA